MLPAGYMAKRIESRPDWLKSDGVKDLYSLSGCISKYFCDYIPYWKHNGISRIHSTACTTFTCVSAGRKRSRTVCTAISEHADPSTANSTRLMSLLEANIFGRRRRLSAGARKRMLLVAALGTISGRRTFTLDVQLRSQHYLQACAQSTVLLYWGWHVRFVYAFLPLIFNPSSFPLALVSVELSEWRVAQDDARASYDPDGDTGSPTGNTDSMYARNCSPRKTLG